MKTVRVKIYICVLDDGDWYAGGWPGEHGQPAGADLYGDLKECVREWAFDKEDEKNRAHYFWIEADIKVRQDGHITITPDLSAEAVKKYATDEIAKALTKIPSPPKQPIA